MICHICGLDSRVIYKCKRCGELVCGNHSITMHNRIVDTEPIESTHYICDCCKYNRTKEDIRKDEEIDSLCENWE